MAKRFMVFCLVSSLTCLILSVPAQAGPLAIKGSNGRVVEFLGVRQANAEGVFVMINRAQGEIFVPWTAFDLPAMQTEHPQIHRAYQRLRAANAEAQDLNLGIYANLLTLEGMLEKAGRLGQQAITLPVPPMSHFFDINRFETNYTGSVRNYYSTWQRRSEDYARNYERLLDEFFRLPSGDARHETWQLFVDHPDNLVNTVITEVHPPRQEVQLSLQQLINDLSNPEMRNRSLVIAYYRSHKEIYNNLMGFFNELSAPFDENRILGQQRDIMILLSSLDRAKAHIVRMEQSAVPDAAHFHRDFARFCQEWKLLPPDPRRR